MSFGRPPGFSAFTVSPPDRGSFPLDHDGECKEAMKAYMSCMKANANHNGKCRVLSKQYLQCRMDHGLMEKDDMKNLGYQGDEDTQPSSATGTSSTGTQQQSNAKQI
ncbi:hypothetical protein K437DRAFT_246597 [Tilletiaria anomala UBC 951]|uniref:Cytochrome c oxidase assembly protein COX19 n=1 Tax=Tilletiaria anomala (strain ATCC 24038 / CBS 436.72 / UBC 951) TaxID=1037660 RepID=A0A066W688_TILAU|nr:uncharacterized protein K437DRAFT_246597 [Tilletiaria anomala UBC 951]KDN46280.1 hypothetical protein K437DRAFT_246597 [Tilletiaria anomala UBC 951]